ncbi:MAG: heterotetrameric sarcosine oxidase delta subunit [Gammaproteobacteria bacterium]|jgi:heterotetrameric sarcosine oxidase delta subunit
MLLVPCPYCGERDQSEFSYGGPEVEFPSLDADAAEWHQAVHNRNHSSESIKEFWYHESGCESWFVVERCVKTHEFLDLNVGDNPCN